MRKLNLKTNDKAIRAYYITLQQYKAHAITHEGAVSSPFDTLWALAEFRNHYN